MSATMTPPSFRFNSIGRHLVWRLGGVGVILALGCLSVTVGGCSRWISGGSDSVEAQTSEVALRDFTVVLKEKGELKAAKSTDIKCEVEGRSTIIWLVPEGTAVEEGDLLVELASDEIEERIRSEELRDANAVNVYEAAETDLEIQLDRNASDIRKGELEITLKRLALDKYTEGDYLQTLQDHKIAIEQADIMLERSEEKYEAAQQLFDKEFYTKTEFKEAEINYKKAKWDLEKAKRALEVLEAYTHTADLKQKESDLAEATKECERIRKAADAEAERKRKALETKKKELELIQDQLAKFRTQQEKCKVYAPTQGFVVYGAGGGHYYSFDGSGQIKEGATVHERQIMMRLPDTSQMIAVVRIHEAKTDRIKMGQDATLEIEGLPGQQFTGTVTKIAVVADTQNRWLNPDLKEYETEITMESNGTALKPGVTAHAEIMVERVEQRLAVPVQAVFTKSGRNFVFQLGDSGPEPVEVKLGTAGSEWVEVLEGIDQGEQVLLAVSEEHEHLLPDLPPAAPQIVGAISGVSAGPAPGGGPSRSPGAQAQPQGGGPRRHDVNLKPGTPAVLIKKGASPAPESAPAAQPTQTEGSAPAPPAADAPAQSPPDTKEQAAEPAPPEGTQAS